MKQSRCVHIIIDLFFDTIYQ